MIGRSRALAAALACLALAALAGCGEKEEPDLDQLPPPNGAAAGESQPGETGREPQPTEGRPVVTPEGAVRRAVTRAVGGDPVVGPVRIRDGRATATARPRNGPYAGRRVEVVLERKATRWRVVETDPEIPTGP